MSPDNDSVLTVYLIDPFDDERLMYADYFRSVGFCVHAFDALAPALATSDHSPPDVILAHLRQRYGRRVAASMRSTPSRTRMAIAFRW